MPRGLHHRLHASTPAVKSAVNAISSAEAAQPQRTPCKSAAHSNCAKRLPLQSLQRIDKTSCQPRARIFAPSPAGEPRGGLLFSLDEQLHPTAPNRLFPFKFTAYAAASALAPATHSLRASGVGPEAPRKLPHSAWHSALELISACGVACAAGRREKKHSVAQRAWVLFVVVLRCAGTALPTPACNDCNSRWANINWLELLQSLGGSA